MRAFVVGGTHSGCGKTTVTLGLLAALAARGLKVQPFKAGPDFIDSGLHRLATGRTSRNLDLWMCGEGYVRGSFLRHGSLAEVSVVEGVMGLYDGDLSTARLARVLDIPVILVVDAFGMAESAGPMVKGFKDWALIGRHGGMALGGVIFNRVASPAHFERLKRSVEHVPVLGYLPRDLSFDIPHRHLGLVVAEENPVSAHDLKSLAESVLAHVDIDRLLSIAASPAPSLDGAPGLPEAPEGPSAQVVRIAVALDKAFCFYYQDNLDLLKESGGEIVFFSPLADARLPENVDGVYIGGGYPELHAAALSANRSMRASLREWAETGGLLYGECGGLMYLCRSLADFEGRTFEMAGVFPFHTIMTDTRAALGYREVSFFSDCMLGLKGARARGHEFHYSKIADAPEGGSSAAYRAADGRGAPLGAEGYRYKGVLGSYVHLHFGSNPAIAARFVAWALKARERQSVRSAP